MRINLSPQRRDDSLTVSVAGDVLTVNGEAFDFSPLSDGATLPYGSIDSEWFAGPVSREEGQLTVTLLLPHKPNPSSNVIFPAPIVTTGDGPVSLPVDFNDIEEEIVANGDN
jgi:hypothetical protein